MQLSGLLASSLQSVFHLIPKHQGHSAYVMRDSFVTHTSRWPRIPTGSQCRANEKSPTRGTPSKLYCLNFCTFAFCTVHIDLSAEVPYFTNLYPYNSHYLPCLPSILRRMLNTMRNSHCTRVAGSDFVRFKWWLQSPVFYLATSFRPLKLRLVKLQIVLCTDNSVSHSAANLQVVDNHFNWCGEPSCFHMPHSPCIRNTCS